MSLPEGLHRDCRMVASKWKTACISSAILAMVAPRYRPASLLQWKRAPVPIPGPGVQPTLGCAWPMAAQLVTPFCKSHTRKNDRNDAAAIATAARQGNMRIVAIRSVDQQAPLAWYRVREGYKAETPAIGNPFAELLAEFGVAVAKRDGALRAMLSDQARREHLPTMLLDALEGLAGHWQQVHARLAECDRRVVATSPRLCACFSRSLLDALAPGNLPVDQYERAKRVRLE